MYAIRSYYAPIQAQSIKIALLNSKEINSVTVSIQEGRYLLKVGNEIMGEYKKGSIFRNNFV